MVFYAQAANTRVLLLAPTAKDGEVTRRILLKAGIECIALKNLHELNEELGNGAGALLMTDEAFADSGIGGLVDALENQPSWSDIPIVIMMRGAAESPITRRVMVSLRNIIVLERPAPMRSLVSAVQAAIRSRMRQFQIRDQIDTIQRAERHARELQQRLELAVDASELGTFHCELPDGELFWNARCKSHFWLGPDVETIDFEMFYSLLHPDDRERTRAALEESVNEGAAYDIEFRTISADDRIRWVRASGKIFFDMNGQPERFDGTTRDITPEKLNAQERFMLLQGERAARQEAERVSGIKDEFLATLSHELRTPLSAIFGWTQLLIARRDDPNTLAHGLDVIDRNVRVQMQLIEDLLDVSRIISGKVRLDIQRVNVPEIIDAAIESVKPAADAKDIRLERMIDPHASPVSGDPGRLQQVLWNLLTNAIKFTDKGGTVQVMAGLANSDVEISISDTGQGISADFLPDLFSRFTQADSSTKRKHGGLGLGLSIVESLIVMHGGTVTATSPGEGQGATFIVTLPLRVVDTRAEDLPPSRMSSDLPCAAFPLENLRGVKVLVVDDEADARELVKRLLVTYEAVPALAASAADALKLIETFAPAVIISDIGMPDQDGYAFMRILRSQGVKTPSIALTAFARENDRIHSIQAGYQAHLPKPFEPLELLALVAGLSGQHDKVD